LRDKEKSFKDLKDQFDTYERNKIIKARYELEVEQKQVEIDAKQLKLDNYENNKKKLEDNRKIDAEIVGIRTKIETANADIRLNGTNTERHKNNIANMKEKIGVNEDLIKKIKSEEELLQVFKVYLTVYGKNGISKVILKNMVPLINQELYRLLVDSCHFILEMNINDKNEVEFIMIDNETRIAKPLNAGSGYERTISSLALRSVLTKISSLPKPNIVVMDEVFGKIADENLEMVGEFFKKIKNYFEHIIVISHNPLIRNWSDNLIMIKKDENVSSIDFITTKIS
jgi:DNA repair exonuclease SbcCD ATPase subunit